MVPAFPGSNPGAPATAYSVHTEDKTDAPSGNRVTNPRATNRGSFSQHFPYVEEVIEPESLICGCGGCLHRIGEDVSERLDVVAAQFRVIVTRHPKYACRACMLAGMC